MAIRQFFKSAAPTPPQPERLADAQVDYSYTQWRRAQMQQLVHSDHAARDLGDSAPA